MVLEPNDPRMFWNSGGKIACSLHAPSPTGEQWKHDGWRPMTAEEHKMFMELARKGVFPPPTCDVCDELGTHR
jgi:hypothetical protein